MREENKNHMKKLQPLFNVFNFLLFLFLELSCSQKFSLSSINIWICLIILSVESFVFLKQPRKYTIAIIILINLIFLFMLYTSYTPASLLFLKLEQKIPIILLITTAVFTLLKTVFEIILLCKRKDNVFKTKER